MAKKKKIIKKDIPLGKVINSRITKEMEKSYLDYAMSVIVARALPDVRDGLKPVQRRILYAMYRLGLHYHGSHKKSARIVGETIGKYHPHGDMAVYEAMVRMAQDFSLRYPLVNGQGNFGSIDNDPPAAQRYTEAKLDKITEELLKDIDRNTVRFLPNFDASEEEPEVLPASLPNFFLNGADGIAVGMATKIPPHNLGEIVDTLNYVIDHLRITEIKKDDENKPIDIKITQRQTENLLNQETALLLPKKVTDQLSQDIALFDIDSDVLIEQLFDYLHGPDFPTGGAIYDQKEIIQAYATGKGRVLLRGIAEIKEDQNDRFQIIISEIPYQLNKAQLVAKIADLVQEKKLTDISDIRDESDRQGLRVVIDLKKSANPNKTLNRLYKYTQLQTTYHINMVALIHGQPQLLTLKTALVEYLKHRKEIVIRRSIYDLYQNLYRAHILEGLKKALDFLDEVIETIKKSADTEKAKNNLMTKFDLTILQAQAILDMQLKRLAALEREKIAQELEEKHQAINAIKEILGSPTNIMNIVKNELSEIKEKYADKRRTKVFKGKPGEITEEDLIKSEDMIIILSKAGYIKRIPTNSFKTQNRGGKGVKGGNLKEEDINQEIVLANTLDEMLFFTDKGRVFSTKVYELPQSSRQARGQAVVNILPLEGNEKVMSILAAGQKKS